MHACLIKYAKSIVMLMQMSLALLTTEKDHFRAKNNNLRNKLLAYCHPKSVDFLRVG